MDFIKMGKEDSIDYHVDRDGILTIKIDTKKEIGPSASGKTTLIASSGGNAKLDIGLNVEQMIEAYQINPSRETVDKLAESLDKSVKSIIGKLSREGVYQKQVYKTKTGEVPMTKQEIVVMMAEVLDIDSSKIMGLEKAPKQDIKFLSEVVSERIMEARNG